MSNTCLIIFFYELYLNIEITSLSIWQCLMENLFLFRHLFILYLCNHMPIQISDFRHCKMLLLWTLTHGKITTVHLRNFQGTIACTLDCGPSQGHHFREWVSSSRSQRLHWIRRWIVQPTIRSRWLLPPAQWLQQPFRRCRTYDSTCTHLRFFQYWEYCLRFGWNLRHAAVPYPPWVYFGTSFHIPPQCLPIRQQGLAFR